MIAPRSIRACAVVAVVSLAAWVGESEPLAYAEADAKSAPQVASQLSETEKALRSATRTLQEAVGDEAQQVAKAQLLTVISNHFDSDLEGRRHQLSEIEARLTKLK